MNDFETGTTAETMLDSIAGVDEAGRGPLAGPVVAAAVILDPGQPIAGLADSKTLGQQRREELAAIIRARARAWSIAEVSVPEIDRINILQASLEAMRQAVVALQCTPRLALVDGNRAPTLACHVQCVVGGDATEPAISAASILAKVHRDELMLALHARFPLYGFDRHKGYPTALHLQALATHGPCEAHRRSFAPVARASAGTVPESPPQMALISAD